MANTFYINWQDPDTRSWQPVAKLARYDGLFFFGYTKGSLKSENFLPFGNMVDLKAVYVSPQLFPIFANRVMNEKRPEYRRYAEWSGLEGETQSDPLLLMARMGGARATDTLQVYPVPEKGPDGLYRTLFFSHGLGHLPEGSHVRVEHLSIGEKIFPMLDVQNPYDEHAVALRTGDPATLIGYCPRYLAADIVKLSRSTGAGLKVAIKKVNHDAPAQYRLLCEATASWPKHFSPCGGEDHETIAHFNLAELSKHLRRRSSVHAQQEASRDHRDISAT